jgi:hypothetical protein
MRHLVVAYIVQTGRDGGYIALPPSSSESHRISNDEPSHGRDTPSEPLLPRDSSGRGQHWGTFNLESDGYTYTYNYGPKGLAGLLHNYYALLCAFFASIGGLTFGYDQGVVRRLLLRRLTCNQSRFPSIDCQRAGYARISREVAYHTSAEGDNECVSITFINH